MKMYKHFEMQQLVISNGFVFDHQSGGHMIYKRGTETIVLTRKMQEPVIRRLIKQHKLCTKKKARIA